VGIRCRNLQLEMEDATLIWSPFRTPDISMPQEEIVLKRAGSDSHRRHFLVINLLQVFDQSLGSEVLSLLACDCP
jgi:hypothetical protein